MKAYYRNFRIPIVFALLAVVACGGGPALRGNFQTPGDRGRITSYIEAIDDDTLTVAGKSILVPAITPLERSGRPDISPEDLRSGWDVVVDVEWLGNNLFRARSIEVVSPPERKVELDGILDFIRDGRLRIIGRWVSFSDGPVVTFRDEQQPAGTIEKLKPGTDLRVEGIEHDDGVIHARRIEILGYGLDNIETEFVKLGLQESTNLESRMIVPDDLTLQEYVSDVGDGLIPEYARNFFDFQFTVIHDPSLNAFALPDGSIYVHTGLLARLENEAQLACVLAHEAVHVTRRHAAVQYKGRNKFNLLTAVLQVSAEVLGAEVNNPLLRNTIYAAADLASSAAVNGYGRELEDEADEIGLVYTWDSGYDIREAPRIWEIFSSVTGDVSEVENFFYGNHSTHAARNQNLRKKIAVNYPDKPADKPLKLERTVYLNKTVGAVLQTAIDDYKLGRLNLARDGFRKVLRIQPNDPTATQYLKQLNDIG
ncbi:M48 family metalloprotease [candidate division KSB1 bacterium]